MHPATAKCEVDRRITRVISPSTAISGKIGPSHLLSEHGDLPFLLFFSKHYLVENIQVSKKFIGNFYFGGITLKEFWFAVEIILMYITNSKMLCPLRHNVELLNSS